MKHSTFGQSHISGSQVTLRIRTKMKPATWIVSYPRSGNTFVRSLLANYFSGLDRPLKLEEIANSTQGEHDEMLWTRVTGKKPSERSLQEQWNARPLYFERLRAITEKTLPLIKSHTLLGALDGRPAFQFVPGDRIIYIVRHPCDVVLSASKFNDMGLDESIDRQLATNRYVCGQPNHGYELIGSWSQHVRSWMLDPGVPVHRIRYIDIVENGVNKVMDMVRFLNCEPDPARARLAVEFSSFDRLQAEEKEKGFVEASKVSALPFFREGRPGQWLDTLTVNQARKILDADPELIDHFGFRKLSSG